MTARRNLKKNILGSKVMKILKELVELMTEKALDVLKLTAAQKAKLVGFMHEIKTQRYPNIDCEECAFLAMDELPGIETVSQGKRKLLAKELVDMYKKKFSK
jgi:hypothetical protein